MPSKLEDVSGLNWSSNHVFVVEKLTGLEARVPSFGVMCPVPSGMDVTYTCFGRRRRSHGDP